MRVRRLARGLLAPIALLALVGTLATLQYRWLGQVSEAERDQLRRSLDRRAHEFADDFDREITRLYNGLQPAGTVDPAAPVAFAKQYDAWAATTATPNLVRAVYMARPREKESAFELFRYDAASRTFQALEWPPELDVVRRRMTGSIEDEGKGPNLQRVVTINATTVVPEVPALVLPMPVTSDVVMPRMGPGVRFDHELLMSLRMSHSHLIVQLDANTLSTAVLPALMMRHFGEPGAVAYRVSVVDKASKPITSMNVAENDPIDPNKADVNEPFFTVRPDVIRSAMLTWTTPVDVAVGAKTGAVVRSLGNVTTNEFTAVTVSPVPTPASGAKGIAVPGPVPSTFGVKVSNGSWRLLVQHSAGSLDAAVATARRHNLVLSFGILAVLAASVGLIVINARRSERLAAQQMDFVATVSHELRTPLAVIRSAAQNLSAGVVHEAAQAQKYGDLIEGEGRRLTEMVEQVLEYAGLEGNRRTLAALPVDAGWLASDVVASCSALFEAEGCEVTTTIAPDLPPVAADENALRRALNNLLMNALKYAATGRTVQVDVQAANVRGQREVQIAVTDHGPGIDADDLTHIFEPFYRGRYATERQIHGNGLGLSLVKRIAEAHGGRVTVKSTPGAGATFTLHLPAAPAHAAVQPLEPAADAGGSTTS